MTAPMLMTDCPTEETLAAYVDDRLDAATRQKVTEHLTTCGECRELVLMASDFQAIEAPANVVGAAFGRRGWIAAVAGLAAAAGLMIVVLRPSFVFGPDRDDLTAAAGSLNYLMSAGKPPGIDYKDEFPKNRGGEPELSGHVQLLAIAADVEDPHIRGTALLLSTTDSESYKFAVEYLKKAYAIAQREGSEEDRDAIGIDLAVALLGRFAREEDYEYALKLSEDLLRRKQSLEATWNRAAALELLQRDDEAIKAWDDYLRLDPNSEWAQEAAKRRSDLLEFRDVSAPQPTKR